MDEIWKPINGFEKYEVSNLGHVRSLDRERHPQGGRKPYKVKGMLLKLQPNKKSRRLYVNLYNEKNERTNRMVSRIVAETFIPNPENLKEVNHIDRDVTNNAVDNLEWVIPKENMRHLDENFDFNFGRVAVLGTHSKTGEKITFDTIKDACAYLGAARGKEASMSGISNVLNGIRKTYLGYYWERI